MCLVIDDREDDYLLRALRSYEVSVECARLEFADCSFEGVGPGNRPCLIGIERKHLSDLGKCITDHRLAGFQLRGMSTQYDFLYLVIEDCWRPNDVGGIELFQRGGWVPLFAANGHGLTFRQLDGYLSSLEMRSNVIVLRTGSIRETAALYVSRYHWWQKEWTAHRSQDGIYLNDPAEAKQRGKARLVTRTAGLVEMVAAQLPGIDQKAWAVGEKFKTVEEMVGATEREWMEIKGIGKGIARQVMEALHG